MASPKAIQLWDLLDKVNDVVEEYRVKHNLTKEQAWGPLVQVSNFMAYGPEKLTEAQKKQAKEIVKKLNHKGV